MVAADCVIRQRVPEVGDILATIANCPAIPRTIPDQSGSETRIDRCFAQNLPGPLCWYAAPGSGEKLLELAAKDKAAGLGGAPWPPHSRKIEGAVADLVMSVGTRQIRASGSEINPQHHGLRRRTASLSGSSYGRTAIVGPRFSLRRDG